MGKAAPAPPCGEKLHERKRRKQTALDVLRHRLDRDDVQDERRTTEGKTDCLMMPADRLCQNYGVGGDALPFAVASR